jgi:hypothetical protein
VTPQKRHKIAKIYSRDLSARNKFSEFMATSATTAGCDWISWANRSPTRREDRKSDLSSCRELVWRFHMSEPLFYREIQFSRLGGALPGKVGSFVVGIPTKTIEAYRKEHPEEGINVIFGIW